VHLICVFIFCFCLFFCMVAETSSPYSGVVGLGTAVDGASPGLPLAVPAEPGSQPTSHTGSPDPAALTVLQPSNGSQHYSTMLPSFGYTTGIRKTKFAQNCAKARRFSFSDWKIYK
jgi:hypothetical protein